MESTKSAKKTSITPSDDLVVDLVVALQQTTNKIDMLQAENLALKAQLGAFATKEPVLTPKHQISERGPIGAAMAEFSLGASDTSDAPDATDTAVANSQADENRKVLSGIGNEAIGIDSLHMDLL